MIRKISKYVSIDGQEFNSTEECRKHERLLEKAEVIFDRWPKVKDDGCKFANGGGYVQLTKEVYDEVRNGFLDLVKEVYSKDKDIQRVVEITKNMDSNWGIIGRYLSDYDSPLYRYWCQLMHVDAGAPDVKVKLYRLWGQGFYALNPDKGEQKEWKSFHRKGQIWDKYGDNDK